MFFWCEPLLCAVSFGCVIICVIFCREPFMNVHFIFFHLILNFFFGSGCVLLVLYFDAECLVFWNTHNFHCIGVARFMVCASFHSTLIDDRNGYLHLWCCFFISCLFYLWLNLLIFSIFSTPHFVAPSLQPCSLMSEFDVRFEFFCISLFSFPSFF